MHDVLREFGPLPESLSARYGAQILRGLQYIHEMDVIHRDLKSANVLVMKSGNVKLADFGVSVDLQRQRPASLDVAGTPRWMAPEIIEMKGASTKSDIWSLGCTVVEMLTALPPFSETRFNAQGDVPRTFQRHLR